MVFERKCMYVTDFNTLIGKLENTENINEINANLY